MNERDPLEPSEKELCDQFRVAWQAGSQPDISTYLNQLPSVLHDPLTGDSFLRSLIAIDIEMRRSVGQVVQPSDYSKYGLGAEELACNLLQRFQDVADNTCDQTFDSLPAPTRSMTPNQRPVSQMAGPYKLLQEIGEGGMGVVWMAEQTRPVKRRVALKVIKPGLSSRDTIARFEAERQALAMMEHPNIAKVLDAGTTEDGRPYFVMELVHGIPFTEFCDRNRLNPRERLELFIPVCHAIQHAHQRGIIHRDIKPSNVLVSMHDGQPVPKVIDFGLAKALQSSLTDKTLFTQFGQVLGTLQYMSPEQAEMNALDVDTRTDVYSLGVMLYELLTGSTPLDGETLRKNAIDRVLRMIREVDPPRPSRRLSESGEASKSICIQRHIEPGRLSQLLRGDLDWIVMKAIDKERDRRYESASSLAADIQRYLSYQPVAARPPSIAYRFSKYFRRNRLSASAAAIVVVALMGGFSVATWQSIRATWAERDLVIALENAVVSEGNARSAAAEAVRARQVAEDNFLRARRVVDDYLTKVANDTRLQRELSPLRKKLLQDARRFYEEFLEERGTDIGLSKEIIHSQFQIARLESLMGETQKAARSYSDVIARLEEMLATQNADRQLQVQLATCRANLGEVLLKLDEYDQAREQLESSLQLRLAIQHSDPSDFEAASAVRSSQYLLANLSSKTYQPDQAIPYLEEITESVRKLLIEYPNDAELLSELGASLNELATARLLLGENDLSIAALDEAILHQQSAVELDPTNATFAEYLANHCFNLSQVYNQVGQDRKASEFFARARNSFERLVRLDPSVSTWQLGLARSLLELAALTESDPNNATKLTYLQQSEAILDNQLAVNADGIDLLNLAAQCRNSLALVHYEEGRYQDSLDARSRSFLSLRTLVDNDIVNRRTHQANLARSLCHFGNLQMELGIYDKADNTLTECEQLYCELLLEEPEKREFLVTLVQCYNSHGLSLRDESRLVEADEKYAEAIRLLDQLSELQPGDTTFAIIRAGVLSNCGSVARDAGQLDAAIGCYDQAIELLGEYGQSPSDNATAIDYLFIALTGKIDVLVDANRIDQAVEAATDALQRTHPQIGSRFRLRRAYCRARLGEHAAAMEDIEALVGRVEFDARAMLNIGQVFSLCSESLKNVEAELARNYADRALDWLELFVARLRPFLYIG